MRERYGGGPLHMLAALAMAAIAGYAIVRIFGGKDPVGLLIWFVGAILLHDVVAFPLYSAFSRIAFGRAGESRDPRVLAGVNHVRIPLFFSAIMLLVWFPLIFGLSDRYEGVSGLSQSGFMERWLLLSAAAFIVSGLIYAIRLRALTRSSA